MTKEEIKQKIEIGTNFKDAIQWAAFWIGLGLSLIAF